MFFHFPYQGFDKESELRVLLPLIMKNSGLIVIFVQRALVINM
jgi:hypothetical protein